MTARKVRNQNSPRKRISYGRHKLVLLKLYEDSAPACQIEPERKPKHGIKFVWKDGRIVDVT